MGIVAAVWMVARSILGRRWRGLTTVALIVGLAGGVTLAALAGARRTASSFDRFLDSARVHQVLVLDDDIRLSDMPRIRAIPGVAAAGLGRFLSLVDNDGRFFDAGPLVTASEASRWLLPSDGLWRGTIYGLEPPLFVFIALGRNSPAGANPFSAAGPPTPEFVAWSVVWVAIVLGLAVFSLSRRDL